MVGYGTVTFDVKRPGGTDDAYGGESGTTTVYTGLTGVLSHPSARSNRAGGTPPESAQGPGGVVRTQGVLIIEPKPTAVTIKRADVIDVSGGSDWTVVGIRDQYEFTLQIDLELIQ